MRATIVSIVHCTWYSKNPSARRTRVAAMSAASGVAIAALDGMGEYVA
jgi:hypothetical protein